MALSPELVVRYTRRYNRIRLQAASSVGRAWDALAGLDDASATRFATTAATLASAAQSQAAANLDAYLALLLDQDPLGIDEQAVIGAAVRAGAEPEDVYLRSIVTARAKVSEGIGLRDALHMGKTRAVSTAETDVALTQRAAMAGDERVVGYRRVLTGKSCAFCGTASTQRYRRGDLMPLHQRCDCGVVPIMGTKDPGHVINKKLLSDLKSAGRKIGDPDYRNSRHLKVTADGQVIMPKIAVHQHAELGPVLTDASHDFAELGIVA